MTTLYFQGRGPGYLQEIQADGSLKTAIEICLDAISIDMSVLGEWEHINRCGTTDVVDASGDTGYSAGLNFQFANMEDKLFALGALGIVVPAGSPGVVSDEVGPLDPIAGDIYFLGGKTRHRAITSLVVTDEGTSPATTKTLNTHYTIDAATGKVTFLTAWTGYATFSYGYTDPQYASMLNAAVKHYMFSYEFMNRQSSNDPGSLVLYKIRLSPASNLDFMSAEAQSMSLKGKALADTDRPIDGPLGQFGMRVL